MPRFTRHRLVVGALSLLLAVSIAGNVLLYRPASRPLYEEGERPLIERTIALFATSGTSASEIRAQSFPIVMRLGDRTCVQLRRYDGLGHLGACYDRQGGLIEENSSVVN